MQTGTNAQYWEGSMRSIIISLLVLLVSFSSANADEKIPTWIVDDHHVVCDDETTLLLQDIRWSDEINRSSIRNIDISNIARNCKTSATILADKFTEYRELVTVRKNQDGSETIRVSWSVVEIEKLNTKSPPSR